MSALCSRSTLAAAAISDSGGMSKGGSVTATISVPATVLDGLAAQQGLFIKQRLDFLEVACNWEVPNKYDVYGWRPVTGEKPTLEEIHAGITTTEPIMRTEEDKGSCCARQVCKSARAFKMGTKLVIPTGVSPTPEMMTPLRFSRPFRCTFFCLARPVCYIWWGDKVIAEVTSPFDCCEYRFSVGPPTSYPDRSEVHPDMVSAPEAPWYSIHKHMCSSDLCCLCCYPEVAMAITDSTRSGERVGSISRVWRGCCEELLSKATNYSIAFPDGALPIQKAALLCLAILVDFTMFEQDANNNSG